jgi:hypothetical protein
MTRQSSLSFTEDTHQASKILLELLRKRQEIEQQYAQSLSQLANQFKLFLEGFSTKSVQPPVVAAAKKQAIKVSSAVGNFIRKSSGQVLR